MAFREDRVQNIVPRKADEETITREWIDGEHRDVKTVRTFRMGAWEIMKIQEGLDNLDDGDREKMAYLEWLLGSCEDVEITIKATYDI